MVQRKNVFLDVMSQELKKNKKKMMKRTRPTRLKDSVSTPGTTSYAKVTGGSPNYMKGTTSSEARREIVPRNARVVGSGMEILSGKKKTGTKHSVSEKQGKGLCRRNSSLKMTKTPSFKRCSRNGRVGSDVNNNVGRATCSSALKDSKFPEYLMLSPEGTSVFKVCPYTFCSLNGHLHAQFPPLKCFISARRRALKSQRGAKIEACSSRKGNPSNLARQETGLSLEMQEKCGDGFVEIYVAEKRESENENGFCSEGDGEVSMSLSDGAPRSEIDSEESFGFYNDVFAAKKGPNERFVGKEGEEWEVSETDRTFDDMEESEIAVVMEWEGDCFKKPGVGSDVAEMMNMLEFDDGIESKETDSDNGQAVLEKSENASEDSFHSSDDAIKKTASEGEEYQEPEASSLGISINFLLSDENIIQTDEAALELNDHLVYTPEDSLSLEAKGDAADVDAADESEKDVTEEIEEPPEKQAQDYKELDKERVYRFGLTEEFQEIGKVKEQSELDSATEEIYLLSESKNIQGEKTDKIAFARGGSKATNQSQPVDFSKWIIKYKRDVEDLEALRGFNPREPNYLPVVAEADAEKVDLKHQDIDERKNREEWMIDYALQRAVTKLAPASKKKKKRVALLVEAFETVMPVSKCQTHGKGTSASFTCGMPLQACN